SSARSSPSSPTTRRSTSASRRTVPSSRIRTGTEMTPGPVLGRTDGGPLDAREQRVFSFEFYPPKTAEGAQKLRTTWKQLGQLKPQFFSVTFGAGGSTREGTLATVL